MESESGIAMSLESTMASFIPSSNDTLAPAWMMASMHDCVSAEMSGFDILEISLAKNAIRNALIVWLFDAGTDTVPAGLDGLRVIIPGL